LLGLSRTPLCTQVVLPNASHACYIDQPDAWNAALTAFVRQQLPGGTGDEM
jgi:pimeloyl-ACP methyl ester carboxylesterase